MTGEEPINVPLSVEIVKSVKLEVAKEGWINLRTEVLECFDRVYVKLWTNSLRMQYFYKDPMNEVPKYVDLSEIHAIQRVSATRFTVLTRTRKWEFQCMTETQMISWVKAICTVT